MHLSLSLDHSINPFVVARTAVLNGETIPATAAARLEAIGVDVGELEARLIETRRFQ